MRLNRQYSVLLCAEAEFLLFLRKDMNTIVYLLIVLLEKVTDTQVRIIQNLVYGKKKICPNGEQSKMATSWERTG